MAHTIETVKGRVRRAQLFYQNIGDLFIGIGRSTAWTNEEDPPEPTGLESDIEEAIGFKQVNQMHYVVKDEVNGTLSYRNELWRIVDPADIFTEDCHWIYISGSIVGDELPLTDYRQIGIFSGLTPYTEYSANTALLPSHVEDRGVLEIIGNRKKVVRELDQTDKPIIILEF